MSTIISLLNTYIQNKHLGYSSIDRDFSTLQETSHQELENRILSAKKWKWLQLQRELQSPSIVILLDVNCNMREHFNKYKINNPIHAIVQSFSSDYSISIQTSENDISDNRFEYVMGYQSTVYGSSIRRLIKQAKEMLDAWVIPIVVSDFLDYSWDLRDLLCIQLILPVFSSHYHAFYVTPHMTLQTDYLYEW